MQKLLDVAPAFLVRVEHLSRHANRSHSDGQAGDPQFDAHHYQLADLKIAGHGNHKLSDLGHLQGGGLLNTSSLPHQGLFLKQMLDGVSNRLNSWRLHNSRQKLVGVFEDLALVGGVELFGSKDDHLQGYAFNLGLFVLGKGLVQVSGDHPEDSAIGYSSDPSRPLGEAGFAGELGFELGDASLS